MTDEVKNRALDRNEQLMVEQSHDLHGLSRNELLDLQKRLRARRDRAQRLIRTRVRQAQGSTPPVDAGARQKKALLVEALDRVAVEANVRREAERRDDALTARRNLDEAVRRKALSQAWRGPEDRTANNGPAETPNMKIAPSGALHAEGMRAAISRSTGDR